MKMADHSGKTRPPPATLDRLRAGCIVYKHDFHRTKRVRKLLFVDDSQGPGASAVLKWQNASGAPQPSPPPRSGLGIASPRPDSPAATPRRSASDGSSVSFFDIAQVCFGPYTRNFSRRSVEKRIDVCYRCFSLLLSSDNRSVDFAFEDEADIMPWLLGLQQLVCYYAPTPIDQSMIWTEPKLHVQILRLKLQAEAESKQCSLLDGLVDITRDVSRGVFSKHAVGTLSASAQSIAALDQVDVAAITPVQSV